MIKCDFSHACQIPGPRLRLEGTTREYCPHHYHAFELPLSDAGGRDLQRSAFLGTPLSRSNGRRSRWQTYAGISEQMS